MIFFDLGAGVSSACHKAIAAVARELDAGVVVQPALGVVSPTDLGMHRLIRQQRADLTHYAGIQVQLAVLPLARRGVGERDLALRAIVACNGGATHLVVDPSDYGLEDEAAVPLVARFGVEPILRSDLQIPGGDVAVRAVARRGLGSATQRSPPRSGRGDRFFTGLSGAGKSTIARALTARVAALGRTVTLLDGDLIRRHLLSELTFSAVGSLRVARPEGPLCQGLCGSDQGPHRHRRPLGGTRGPRSPYRHLRDQCRGGGRVHPE